MSLSKNKLTAMPPKALIKIFGYLPFKDVEKVRRLSKAFDEAGVYIANMAIRNMNIRGEALTKQFSSLYKFKEKHGMIFYLKYLYLQRMNKGASSLMVLTGMIRVCHASTFYLVQDGILPPFGSWILNDFNKALKYASRRNPLVGARRLNRIATAIAKHFAKHVINARDPQKFSTIRPTTLFRTVAELLTCIPVQKEKLVKDRAGYTFTCRLTKLYVAMELSGHIQVPPVQLLMTLVMLAAHGLHRLIDHHSRTVILPGFEIGPGRQRVHFTSMEIRVVTRTQEAPDITCLRELPSDLIEGFAVTLCAAGENAKGEELPREQASSLTYRTISFSESLLPWKRAKLN